MPHPACLTVLLQLQGSKPTPTEWCRALEAGWTQAPAWAEPGGLAACHKQRLRAAGLLLGPSEPEDAGLDATDLPGRVIYRHTTSRQVTQFPFLLSHCASEASR